MGLGANFKSMKKKEEIEKRIATIEHEIEELFSDYSNPNETEKESIAIRITEKQLAVGHLKWVLKDSCA